ncbi:MAG TPA: S53 family peptidase [Pirellulales bacterium]|nr:S53 family peptidase [Pirellulales bacterium]
MNPARQRRLVVEALEGRTLLSVSPTLSQPGGYVLTSPDTWYNSPQNGVGATPSQIKHAYGFDNLSGNGSGQTIAIIDPWNDTTIASDLQNFDSYFGLPAPPSFSIVAEDGSQNFQNYPVAGQQVVIGGQSETVSVAETALDVEWAHALAPAANILLVQAQTNIFSFQDQFGNQIAGDELKAIQWAEAQPGVSVVSMSFGVSGEFNGETNWDSTFLTPTGHTGIVFVAATGDTSQASYPATSPNVVAVGGTTLSIDTSGDYQSETTWGNTGGGPSGYEAKPAYQNSLVGGSARATPDVAFASVENIAGTVTGVWMRDTADAEALGPSVNYWTQQGGTSFSTLGWAALTAITDQARAAAGLGPMNGRSETLPDLYNEAQSNFNDITTGNNGHYSALPGYDEVTGRGTPKATSIVPALKATMSPSAAAFSNGAQVAETTDIANPSLQDLFTVGSDGHLREDQFNDSTHTQSGQLIIDSSTPLQPGASITLYNDGSSINLFAVNTFGQIVWDQVKNGVTTNVGTFGTPVGLASGETFIGQAQQGVFNLFAVGADGYIHQFQYLSSTNEWYTYGGGILRSMQLTAHTPLSGWFDGPSGILDFYAELPDANIAQWQYVPGSGWGGGEINASAAQLPSPGAAPGVPLAVTQANGQINIFAVNRSGNVGQIDWYYPAGWAAGIIPAAGASLAVGTPLGVNYSSNYIITIVGVNTAGNIGEVQYVGGWAALTVTASVKFATGSGVTMLVPPSGEIEILGVGSNGHLLDEEHLAAWNEYDLG